MEELKKKFDKEPKSKKVVLVAALIGLVASFLPWFSISFGSWGAASVNGWHSYGLLTTLASLLIALHWLLPKIGVKIKLPWGVKPIYQVLSIVMVAGPVLWIVDTSFSFSTIGLGVYAGLIAGLLAAYYSFAKITVNTR